MKPPILLIEVIENAIKYKSEIRIAKDGDRFYAYVLGQGYTRAYWMSAHELESVIRDTGFTGTITMDVK
jgi:hypothetical protein